MEDLLGKTVLITGAAKGIGRGIAEEFARWGANLVINYHSHSEGLEALAEKARQGGGQAIAVQADVTNDAQVAAMIAAAQEAFGGIDVLVNNAAWQFNLNLEEYRPEFLEKIFRVNLWGYTRMMQAVLPLMKEKGGGKIVNVSSVHAKRPTNFDPGYAMTKGGIRMLTREAALSFARYRINVNSVEFGYVEVEGKSGNPPDPVPEDCMGLPAHFEFLRRFPNGLLATPQNACAIVPFLASGAGDTINGAAVRVDGGNILL